jgi:DNA-binding response OmpR family regulator
MEKEWWDVLIVDDEADILLVVGDYLRRKGLTVLTAQDTSRALQQLDENKVSVVVLDVNLSGGENGMELMSFLKHNYPETRIVIYTGALDESKEVKKALERGASCFVTKGGEFEELLFAVRQVRGDGAKQGGGLS